MDKLSAMLPRVPSASSLMSMALTTGKTVITNPEKVFGAAMMGIHAFGVVRDLARGKPLDRLGTHVVGIVGGAMLMRAASLRQLNEQFESNLAVQKEAQTALKSEVATLTAENGKLTEIRTALTTEVSTLATRIAQMTEIATIVEQVAKKTGTDATQIGEVLTALQGQIDMHKALLSKQETQLIQLTVLTKRQEEAASEAKAYAARRDQQLEAMEQERIRNETALAELRAASKPIYDANSSSA